MNTPISPTVLSLFSGAGGLDIGFKAAGFGTLGFVELESWACDTLRANNPESVVLGPPHNSGDIRSISIKELRATCSDLARPTVVIGGPPCQPYSVAAAQRFLRTDERFKRIGHADERRGGLFLEFYRLVAETQPQAFVLENVPGLLELDGGEAIERMVEDLSALGYQVAPPTVLQAADFGVPQYRRRVFVVGSKAKMPILPSARFNAGDDLLPSHRSVAHALAGMPREIDNHVPRKHAKASIDRYRRLTFGEREKLGRVDRLDPFRPSKTVIAGGSGGGGRSHLHPFIARTMTVRECARIQTFPDDFVFEGTISRQFTQVGNAVPPLLAEQLARSIGRSLGMSFPKNLRLEAYLEHSKSVDALVEQLREEATKERPDWLYDDVSLGLSERRAAA